jgi:hypothetical protein
MSILLDVKFFNYLIMSLYVVNSFRWLLHGDYGQTLYWTAAFLITFSVTFMIGK